MRQIEYTVREISGGLGRQALLLDEMADEGWELVSVTHVGDGFFYAYFKRNIPK